jgi:hypothetical protein
MVVGSRQEHEAASADRNVDGVSTVVRGVACGLAGLVLGALLSARLQRQEPPRYPQAAPAGGADSPVAPATPARARFFGITVAPEPIPTSPGGRGRWSQTSPRTPTIRFAFPPEAAADIAPGTLVEAEVETLPAPLRARVLWVSPEPDPSSHHRHAEAALVPGQVGRVADGLVARISVAVGRPDVR